MKNRFCGELTMVVCAKRSAGRALADRKGATVLEYVVIMAAIAPAAIAGYTAIGSAVAALIARVNF